MIKNSVQTGSEKGTFKFGNPHPSIADRFFAGYVKRSGGKIQESWLSAASIAKKRNRNKKYSEENKEQIASYQKQYRQDNKESLEAYYQNYFEENKEEIKAYKAQYALENKEHMTLYRQQYYEANKDKLTKQQRIYYLENADKYASQSAARRRKLAEAPQAAACIPFYSAARRVAKCLGISFHVDHIQPLSKGGSHSPTNLQIVPANWNLSKSNSNNALFPYNTTTA